MTSSSDNKISFRQYCVALAVTSVTLMELLDTTILNTALPAISVSFQTDIVTLRVSITAYLATLAICIPISGWVADKLGAKRALLFATVLFTGSSMFCGLSTSLGPFVLFRILQGVGGAMMTPVSRIILVRLFRDRGEKNFQKVVSLVAVPMVFGPILGPVLGGWLTTHLSWHWIFFVNLPIGVAAFFAIFTLVQNEPNPHVGPFDLTGFLLAGSGLACVCMALEVVEDRSIPLFLTAGVGLFGLLLLTGAVRHSLGRSNAVFDLDLFQIPSFRIGAVLTVLGTVVQVGMQALLPTLFQLGFGMNALQAGLMTLPIVFGLLAMKPFMASLFVHLGNRRVLSMYPLFMGLTLLGFRSFTPQTPTLLILLILFLFGLWLSVHGNVMIVIPYLGVPREKISRATSLQSTIFQLSLSLGITFGALLLHGLLAIKGLTLALGTSPEEILAAFHTAFTVCGLLCCGIVFVGMNYKTTQNTNR